MDWTSVIEALIFIVGVASGYIIKPLVEGYSGEKGKNLATKEDIQEITKKIEEVKNEYAKQLHVHQLAFETEFDILADLWEKLINLRRITSQLRTPTSNLVLDMKTRKWDNENLSNFSKAYEQLRDTIENRQPFYPKNISLALQKILDLAQSQAEKQNQGSLSWAKIPSDPNAAELNSKFGNLVADYMEITDAINQVEELIRERIAS